MNSYIVSERQVYKKCNNYYNYKKIKVLNLKNNFNIYRTYIEESKTLYP